METFEKVLDEAGVGSLTAGKLRKAYNKVKMAGAKKGESPRQPRVVGHGAPPDRQPVPSF